MANGPASGGATYPTAGLVVVALWIAWLIYWVVSARDVKVTRQRESLAAGLLYRGPMILAAVLMSMQGGLPRVLTRRFLPAGDPFHLAGPALVAAGLGFAVWARRHLGRNWSARVVVKEDHSLVRSGPYKHVRHPIYTGILVAFLGTALTIGEWHALLGMPLMVLSFVVKSRLEERRMRETFPDYEAYQRETAALIPFVY
jgi:protein-S-isoprenylcysteine O-methyltransferase Ste14